MRVRKSWLTLANEAIVEQQNALLKNSRLKFFNDRSWIDVTENSKDNYPLKEVSKFFEYFKEKKYQVFQNPRTTFPADIVLWHHLRKKEVWKSKKPKTIKCIKLNNPNSDIFSQKILYPDSRVTPPKEIDFKGYGPRYWLNNEGMKVGALILSGHTLPACIVMW